MFVRSGDDGHTGHAHTLGRAIRGTASASPSSPAAGFPIEAFADLDDEPVSDELAAELQMSTFVDGPDGYGLGLFNQADPYAEASGTPVRTMDTGHWAGCLPESGAVVVVLTNQVFEDISGMARPLVKALGSD